MTPALISLREDRNQFWFLTIDLKVGETTVSISSTNAKQLIEGSNVPYNSYREAASAIAEIHADISICKNINNTYSLHIKPQTGDKRVVSIKQPHFDLLHVMGVKHLEPTE